MRGRFWLLFILAALLVAACAGGKPDLELGATEMDLGPMVNGEVREFQVEVRNAGKGVLKIEAVSTSCGCTKARVEPTEIAPGAAGTLYVTFDSGTHGPEMVGSLTRQVFIASNDPQEPEVTFTFTAEVTKP